MSAPASRRGEVARQYDLFQATFDAIEKPRKYLNYGYSMSRRQTYEDRQEALCLQVFKAAGIRADDVVVDVGFGSGEQDFLLHRTHDFARLLGFNIAGRQVHYANERARQAGLAEKLSFRHGAAEQLPDVADDSVDVMLAIECAFYFDRPRFYRRAAAVLKPRGRLVLADITLSDRLGRLLPGLHTSRNIGTASSNRTEWEQHFRTHSLRRINAQTWPGAQISVLQIMKTLLQSRLSRAERQEWWQMARDVQVSVLGLATRLLRYDLLVLEKPG